MAQTKGAKRWDWLTESLTSRKEPFPAVKSQLYSLSHSEAIGFIAAQAASTFRETTGLLDFTWRIYYHQPDESSSVSEIMSKAQGYIIFMHGWTASHVIWEDLPAQVCRDNPRLVCLALDVNGFGGSPFIEAEQPRLRYCSPHSEMLAVEQWLDLFDIHRSGRQRQVFTFVGHSMSGAALFHKTDQGWAENRYNLLALAPAMLHKDAVKQTLYRTLGLSIGAGLQYDFLDRFKERLVGPMMEVLAANASRVVKKEHARMFQKVAKGTIAQTFFALGLAEQDPLERRWDNVFVMLGHSDRLVALSPTLDLLATMGLQSWNIQVLLGDHYFFSVSRHSRKLHGFNRAEVLRHILRLHEERRKES
jgi:pimeloyl-ACP methyl ester carboxylesterase